MPNGLYIKFSYFMGYGLYFVYVFMQWCIPRTSKSTSVCVNLGLWAILVVSGIKNQSLPPSCRVKSCTKSSEITLKRGIAYLLILFFVRHFVLYRNDCVWSLVSCNVMFPLWNPKASNILAKFASYWLKKKKKMHEFRQENDFTLCWFSG